MTEKEIWAKRMRNHARQELMLLKAAQEGAGVRAEVDDHADAQVFKLIDLFTSMQFEHPKVASIVSDRFWALAGFRCLLPLSGADGEWSKQIEQGVYRNLRDPSIVKREADGVALNLIARIFRIRNTEPEFRTEQSQKPIKFPYVHEIKYYIINQECSVFDLGPKDKPYTVEEREERKAKGFVCHVKEDPEYDCSHCLNCCSNNRDAFRGTNPVEEEAKNG